MKQTRMLPSILVGALIISLAAPQMGFAEKTRDKLHNTFQKPVVKQAAIGAGIGLLGGALSGESTAMKGAAVGALSGAGTGLVDSSKYMKSHPYVRSTAKGAIIGTGVSSITGRSKLKGAAVGAGVGAGAQAIRRAIDY